MPRSQGPWSKLLICCTFYSLHFICRFKTVINCLQSWSKEYSFWSLLWCKFFKKLIFHKREFLKLFMLIKNTIIVVLKMIIVRKTHKTHSQSHARSFCENKLLHEYRASALSMEKSIYYIHKSVFSYWKIDHALSSYETTSAGLEWRIL